MFGFEGEGMHAGSVAEGSGTGGVFIFGCERDVEVFITASAATPSSTSQSGFTSEGLSESDNPRSRLGAAAEERQESLD